MESKESRRGRYYITRYFTSEDDEIEPEEEMEPGGEKEFSEWIWESCSGQASGKIKDSVMVRFVEEEVSYMADYEINDRQEIQSVHFDPVPVAKRENIWILNRKEKFPDT